MIKTHGVTPYTLNRLDAPATLNCFATDRTVEFRRNKLLFRADCARSNKAFILNLDLWGSIDAKVCVKGLEQVLNNRMDRLSVNQRRRSILTRSANRHTTPFPRMYANYACALAFPPGKQMGARIGRPTVDPPPQKFVVQKNIKKHYVPTYPHKHGKKPLVCVPIKCVLLPVHSITSLVLTLPLPLNTQP